SKHPMGRSLLPIARLASKQDYSKAADNPFFAADSLFQVERKGERVWHRQKRLDSSKEKVLFEHEMEVHYAIGSGKRGYSYLTCRDGFLLQTPISWYSQKN